MRYKFFVFLLALFSSVAFAKTIKVGISAGPSVEVLAVAKKIAKEKYNLDIEPVVFMDYILPNEALNSKDIDMNIFQTVSYLNQSVEKRHYNLATIGNTFIFPMGIYSKKIHKLSELKNESTVGIPNDLSNQGRALNLLNVQQVITLKPGKGEFPNIGDIAKNPKNLKIMTMDGNQLARVVGDVDAVVLNNDFIGHAGFKSTDALAQENPKTAQPYINIIVVNSEDKNNSDYKKVVQVMNSDEVYRETLKLYPGAVKAW